MTISGMHALIYTNKPDEMRAFFRDVLELPHVDAGGGWLIFALPTSELALHPADDSGAHHELTFTCDDVDAEVARLSERGATFAGAVEEQRWGRSTQLELPDGTRLMLYQPRHNMAAAPTSST